MQFKTMAIYSENNMTAINIILGRVSGGQNGEWWAKWRVVGKMVSGGQNADV